MKPLMKRKIFDILINPYYLTGIVLLLIVTKSPKLIFSPAFYGEEGKIFYSEQMKLGWSALTATYAGYLHLYPRLVALIFSNVPIENIPFFYHLSALFAQALLLYSIFRFAGANSTVRILAALATVIIPHGGEVYLNLPNTISIIGTILPLLYFSEKGSFGRTLFESVLIGIAMLSGPYGIIELPFLVALWGIEGFDRRKIQFLATCGVFALIHFSFMNLQVRTANENQLTFVGLVDATTTFVYSLFFSFFGIIHQFWPRFLITIIGGFTAWRKIRRVHIKKEELLASLPLILSGLAIWAAAMIKGLGDYLTFNPLGAGSRYFWPPYVLVSIGLIYLLKDRSNQKALKTLCALILLSSIVRWPSQINSRLPGWREEIINAPRGPVLVRALPNSDWNFSAIKR